MTSGKGVGKDLYRKLTDILSKKGGKKALIVGSASNYGGQETLADLECTFKAGTLDCLRCCCSAATENLPGHAESRQLHRLTAEA